MTHGGPAGSRQHIWTFASALYDDNPDYMSAWNCHCTNTHYNWTYQLPITGLISYLHSLRTTISVNLSNGNIYWIVVYQNTV